MVTERDEWLAERKKGVGGSDVAAIYNEGFGCSRQLYYGKAGIPADFDEAEKPVLRLGRHLEALVADEYAEHTGRTLAHCDTVVDPERPWRRANPDRRILDDARGDGLLEIKTFDPRYFRRVKDQGVRDQYVRQLQWSMGLAGVEWGAFALYDRGGGELIAFDVAFDRELYDTMAADVDRFWHERVLALVTPDPLPEIDDRCRQCAWRRTCRGVFAKPERAEQIVELEDDPDPALDNAVGDFLVAKAERDGAEARVDEAKARVVGYLTVTDDNGEVVRIKEAVRTLNGAKIHYKEQRRSSWDSRGLDALGNVLVVEGDTALAVTALEMAGYQAVELKLADRFKLAGTPFRALRIYVGGE